MRKYTNLLLDAVAEGRVDMDRLIMDLTGWMSEPGVEQFCRANDYWFEEEKEV